MFLVRLVAGGASLAAVIFLVLIAALWYFQRALIFPKPGPAQAMPIRYGRKVEVDVSGERRPTGVPDVLVGCYFAAQGAKHTLAFWHGNADQLGNVADQLGRVLNEKHGLGFFGIEFPGYALMAGEPTEESISWSAKRMLEHLSSPGGLAVPPSKICLFGQSIGGAVAVRMAAHGSALAGRCIVLSTFTSIPRMCSTLFPFVPKPELFVLDHFDNREQAKHITMPVLVLHGTKDEIVPFAQGHELASLLPNSTFVHLNGAGHNDTFSGQAYQTFIASVSKFLA
ncbi:Alpha/Beta hydrolase protein [Pelagophyceae sp. CCMP2097]|nr:Alpha/Beta hydrolase protein [Pelagophyceae sp. CCMP2097]